MKRLPFLLLLLGIGLISPLMVIFPGDSLAGARQGLSLWFHVALPALFPFMVIAEILVGLGLPRLLGVILDPIMRPVFRLPGATGLVVGVGFTTGFPIGAIMTGRIYQQGMCNREEASRLIAFTNNSSPLFIMGAVASGLFARPDLGVILALTHYLANMTIGLWLAHGPGRSINQLAATPFRASILWQNFKFELKRFLHSNKTAGEILGSSIVKGMNNLLAIGGYIIFFSVAFHLLQATGLLAPIIRSLRYLLDLLSLSPSLAEGIAAGFLEVTIGCQQAANAEAPLVQRAALASVLLAWAGLSIQAQAAAFVADCNIPLKTFFVSRFFQAILSLLYFFLLLPYFPMEETAASSIFTGQIFQWNSLSFWQHPSSKIYLLFAFLLLLIRLFYVNGSKYSPKK